MKRLIRSSRAFTEDDNFQPKSFTKEIVNDILKSVEAEVYSKFMRKYKDNVQIQFDDVIWTDKKMKAIVSVYSSKGVLKCSGKFEFEPYSEYWDIEDYQQHEALKISSFVMTMDD